MRTSDRIWITLILIAAAAHFTVLLTAGRPNCEAEIEQAYSQGYVQYQKDEYLPKPDHKAPDHRLKEKISG